MISHRALWQLLRRNDRAASEVCSGSWPCDNAPEGCRLAGTGGMRCKVTPFRTYFSDFGLRGNLVHHRAILTGSPALERLQPGPLRP